MGGGGCVLVLRMRLCSRSVVGVAAPNSALPMRRTSTIDTLTNPCSRHFPPQNSHRGEAMAGCRRRATSSRLPLLPPEGASASSFTRATSFLALLAAVLSIDTGRAFRTSPHHASAAIPRGRSRRSTCVHAAGRTEAAVIRERLIDGEREGTLVVSTGRFALIGLPPWSPPLHVGVLLSAEGKGKTRGSPGGRLPCMK